MGGIARPEKPTLFLHKPLDFDYGEPREEQGGVEWQDFAIPDEVDSFSGDDDDDMDETEAEVVAGEEEEDGMGTEQDLSEDIEGREGEEGKVGEEKEGDDDEEQANGDKFDINKMPLPLRAIMTTIALYPEALRLATVDGYFPLHLVCRSADAGLFVSPRLPVPWRAITNDVFNLVLRMYPKAARKLPRLDNNSALN